MTTDDDPPLAAVVDKPDADAAIERLRAAGVYDDDRRIREVGDAVAVPVTTRPEEDDAETRSLVQAVVEQPDPERRRRTLADRLRERGLPEAAVERAPDSWAVVGDVILADFEECPSDRERAVGEALLSLHGEAHTVLAREGVTGPRREPSVRVVAGRGQTETVHREHGTEYALDLARVLFSPGNKAERARMGSVVESGETILDMFAGVGYFALPMARAGARVVAAEVNPVAFDYLLENVERNGVGERVAPYLADCRDVAWAWSTADERSGSQLCFDRVVMGHYDAAQPEFLGPAVDALAPGGVVHVHAVGPDTEPFAEVVSQLEAVAGERGRDVDVVGRRRVKTVDEGLVHVVVDGWVG